MIIPTPKDIGRTVVYRGVGSEGKPEIGTLTALYTHRDKIDTSFVYVRFSQLTSELTNCRRLEWHDQ